MAGIIRRDITARMSQSVSSGDLVWLSGQCGTAFDSIEDQTRTALAKVDEHLAAAGSDRSHLLSVTIWLSDIADYDAMNVIWDAWVPNGCAPARSCGETRIGGDGYDIEIICVAARSVTE